MKTDLLGALEKDNSVFLHLDGNRKACFSNYSDSHLLNMKGTRLKLML